MNVFEIGPLEIHVYGILVGLGVLAAILITERRYVRFGGDTKDVEKAAFWAIVIGFLGARLAYVSTHTARFEGRWLHIFAIWEGGLAFFGGIAFGAIAVIYVLRRRGGSFPMFADAAAIALPAAQGIGRWGNYFNQELFGTPTDLPWGLEIAPRFRPAEYAEFATFHPTFLYESIWNVGVIILLLNIEKRFTLKRGSLLFVYFVVYGIGRFLMELLRTDTSFRLLGISRNGWVALLLAVASAVVFYIREIRRQPSLSTSDA